METVFISILLLFTYTNAYSQDIIATLTGNTSIEGFSVVNALGDTVFRINGEGNLGIGNANPAGLLDTRNAFTTGVGKSIFLQARNQTDGLAGDAIIAGGDNDISGSYGGKITLMGVTNMYNEPTGGDVQIQAGDGYFPGNIKIQSGNGSISEGGDVDIQSASGGLDAGDITLKTGDHWDGGGNLSLITGNGHNAGGEIWIKTGSSTNTPQSINISAGDAGLEGSPVIIKAGNSQHSVGGRILLIPGTGVGGSGMVEISGSGTYTGTWTQASDERFKKNVKPIQNALDKIEKIKGVRYEFNSDEFPEKHFAGGKQIGLIAQDVEKVLPELVKTDNEGYKSVEYQNMVAVLIEAIKEQQKIINMQNEKIVEIQSTLNSLINNNDLSNND